MEHTEHIQTKRPFFVRLGLWGVRTRKGAVAFMWFSVLLGSVALLLKLWTGALLFLAVAWYWQAIRWVDQHDHWQ